MSPYDAGVLVAERETADFFEAVGRRARDAKLAANWVINELFGRLNKEGKDDRRLAGFGGAARRRSST